MYTEHNHNDVVFESCHQINELLVNNDENEARQELIKLLDFHKQNELDYSSLVNHLIRQTTEAMGIGGLRERSLSHCDKVNAGAKPAECTSASLCP